MDLVLVFYPSQAGFVGLVRLQDTLDESHWKNLNKSLHRVSSTTDGKYDAIKEIQVHHTLSGCFCVYGLLQVLVISLQDFILTRTNFYLLSLYQ